MRKHIVPIVSGGVKILGLRKPEWAVFLSPTAFYPLLVPEHVLAWAYIAHATLVLLYVIFLSKVEENIIEVVAFNFRSPNIIIGTFMNKIPIEKNLKAFREAAADDIAE